LIDYYTQINFIIPNKSSKKTILPPLRDHLIFAMKCKDVIALYHPQYNESSPIIKDRWSLFVFNNSKYTTIQNKILTMDNLKVRRNLIFEIKMQAMVISIQRPRNQFCQLLDLN
jgi:hypothetical protein